MPNWLLPENISDCLPAEARRLEVLRRRTLDLFESYGYELVQPPLIEYAQGLADGSGADLDVRMFKLVDQMSGRTLGLRADMTPQVARIDAHRLNRSGVTRLSYCGNVLHARPASPGASREMIQMGAELYGHGGIEADIEILALMLDALASAGLTRLRVEIGHLGLLRALLALDATLKEDDVFPLLLTRDLPALNALLGDSPALNPLLAVASLESPSLAVLQECLPQSQPIQQALKECERLVAASALLRFPKVAFALDLADAHGYSYHSGLTFSVFRLGESESIGRGGRYDDIGKRFGRARPATGFSLDLRALVALTPGSFNAPASPREAILAPWTECPNLSAAISSLRARGEVVIQAEEFDAQSYAEQGEFICNRRLEKVGSDWVVAALSLAS
jgi:ATP phosphoribosyltransferase regulatory subunit